ncbi:uncharacterized protein CcaverHIS019_0201610 [Cutaneotrichosporon cavernicola]|uniref:Uncharacterized protein n=1 Tax=Cutaneotrichosporon cavernicola TaxID=279322 RepID=A0AA48I395_9TREE|nr:uncharacterized protein CcaverHIS019_0201610 [Cutaneotrichosporon cavernicola]BEI88799.1 hypothetical protein CcaverHIS019_0201610 [Cutaneotrichosporon cavernicola]
MSTASSAVLSNVANLDKTIVVLGVFAFLGKRVAEYFDKSLGWSVVGILTERDDTPSNMSSRAVLIQLRLANPLPRRFSLVSPKFDITMPSTCTL